MKSLRAGLIRNGGRAACVALAMAFLFSSQLSLAAPAKPTPFSSGEKSTFAITYFGATAGILDVEILPPTKDAETERTEFSATARTDSIFSLFYYLRNIYRSTVDSSTGLPVRFVATLDETRQSGTTTNEFAQPLAVKGKKPGPYTVRFIDKREDKKKGKIEKEFTKEIPADTQDVISAVFHLRALPLEKGKTFEIPVFIGEELCRLRAEVVDEEELSTKIGKLPSFVLKPSLIKDGIVKEIPETQIWIAKDSNRALLKVKAKVKIGSIIAYLKSYKPGSTAK